MTNAMSTLNCLAPARALLGVGVGVTSPENFGIKPRGIIKNLFTVGKNRILRGKKSKIYRRIEL